ncbi:BREX system serine/threonine kinase PglW [Streptomonospora wellingtoniae]|uniref:BREX system serine/threonine kinase PglW n=1 Tax=Streptomonospora wellingtoniae TaxID=3075544 RepID=A0ABU2KYC3_9ACTN|nr:BREX system serine/threonine kinase PglW [Streptomonospora sp. DSM 45055]MDT0304260.1 BREX system serine/threonine kinase PglW [Streptomonospora sp. DSM 45055]
MAERWWGEPSEFEWEQQGLDHIRQQMPDREPYRAWQCFSFTARGGRVRECDLFLVAPHGVFLLELKAHRGRATNRGGTWFFSKDKRPFDNPLHATDQKSKELRSRFKWAANHVEPGLSIPFIEVGVFLSSSDLVCDFDEVQSERVFGRDGLENQTGLGGVWSEFLSRPSRNGRPSPAFLKNVRRLMEAIGAQPIEREIEFSRYTLDSRTHAAGPTWTDYLGTHSELRRKRARVRIFHHDDADTDDERESVRRAAEREFRSLDGIAHEGIVRAESYGIIEHRGPAIAFAHKDSWQRLDHYVREHGDSLDFGTRVEMVRQLAEALKHAHGNQLFHRALSPCSVWVELDGIYPRLRIADWQVASRQHPSFRSTSNATALLGTRALTAHVEEAALPYLAPEFPGHGVDAQAMDMFGLGAVAFLILSGQTPGDDPGEVSKQIREQGELTPAAASDDVTPAMDSLVRAATRWRPNERTGSLRTFLRGLDTIDEQLNRAEVVTDPLVAVKGQEVYDGWEVASVLGKGSTSRALLVRRLGRNAVLEEQVFKVALNEDSAAGKLRREAAQLASLNNPRIVGLAADGVIDIGERTALPLELAGEFTLAEYLESSLGVVELHRFGRHLFDLVEYLEGQGVVHRDLKPANLGVRERTRKKGLELVLFDFSLAGVPVENTAAGTRGYLDPFLEVDEPKRHYDEAAERYALAATLHEMASGELPVWSEDGVDLAFLPPKTVRPRLAEDSFPEQLRAALRVFFEQALHRHPQERFASLEYMRNAWEQVFQSADVPGGSAEDEETRRRNAESATAETPLHLAGLSPLALDAATRVLRCETVGDLMDRPTVELHRRRGVAFNTRNELVSMVTSWRNRLGVPEPDVQVSAKLPPGADDRAKREASLDKVIRQFVPRATEANSSWVRVVRALLGLPESGPRRLAWPTLAEVAGELGLDQEYVARQLAAADAYWTRSSSLLGAVRDDIVQILAGHGRIREVRQIGEELLELRGTGQDTTAVRLVLALAVVRVAVESEGRRDNPRFTVRRHGSRVLVAQIVDDDPTVPVEADLLDYAAALGARADDLVDFDDAAPLPTAEEVRAALRAVEVDGVDGGVRHLSDHDLVHLAAAASENAQVTIRRELYPKSMGLDRALTLAQAVGYLGPPGITPQQVRDRVKARFPRLPEPTDAQLWEVLAEKHPKLVEQRDERGAATWALPPEVTTLAPPSHTAGAGAAVSDAEQDRLLRRLARAASRGGYLAVKTWLTDAEAAAELLSARGDVAPFDVSAEFVAVLNSLITEFGGPPWNVVLEADREGGPAAFTNLAADACAQLGERIRAAGADRTVFLHGATPLARYPAGRTLLTRLAGEARESGTAPHGLWLLCPMRSPQAPAALDTVPAGIITDAEQVLLPRGFAAGQDAAA